MSILDEIRNRATQPTVSPRQDSLTSQAQETFSDAQMEIAGPDHQDLPSASAHIEANSVTPENQPVSELKQLEDQLTSFPEIASRVPIRLEAEIKEQIDTLCNQEKVTVETLLEAFYTTCKDKDSVMRQVLKEAKKRLQSRKTAGNIRSSITRLKNITKA